MYFALGLCVITILAAILRHRFASFSAQRPSDYARETGTLDIREALQGELICEGVIYGPLGRVNARFVATMHAKWEGNKGHMTEHFRYDNGNTQDREWTLEVLEDGTILATAPDIVGTGRGKQLGPSVMLNYRITLPKRAGGHTLSATDWMYLCENGSIMNRSQMKKFGITVAELIATMRRV